MSFGAVAASVAGAAVGGLMGGGGGGGGEVNKAPWDPAIKPLQNSLTTGQALENYYQQNPFNSLQQVAYQNLFGDLDNFRNVMAPQAMAFNNRMMNTNYQRKPAGAELGGAFTPINASQFLPPEQRQPQGGMGGGMGPGISMGGGMPGMPGAMSQGGGLAGVINDMGGMSGLGAMGSAASMAGGQPGMDVGYNKPLLVNDTGNTKNGAMETGYNKPLQVAYAGLMGGGQPFGMSVVAPNSQSYGLINWAETNPFTATNGIPRTPPVDPNAKTPEQLAREEAERRERDRLTNYGGA